LKRVCGNGHEIGQEASQLKKKDTEGVMHEQLTLNIKPEWDEIERIRNETSAFLKEHGFSVNVVHAIIMVISELLENAIKYGSFAKEEDVINIMLAIEDNIILVEVKNPTDNSKLPYLRHLDETIQWIRGYQDPFETYIVKLRQISTKPLQDTESGLGLCEFRMKGNRSSISM
jgi:hypothetical protein